MKINKIATYFYEEKRNYSSPEKRVKTKFYVSVCSPVLLAAYIMLKWKCVSVCVCGGGRDEKVDDSHSVTSGLGLSESSR